MEEDEGNRGERTGDAVDSLREAGCSDFVWDNDSQLYFQAGTGFYYDPGAGWYYSSRNGLYYGLENGVYVPLKEYGKVSGDSSPSGAPQRSSSAPDSVGDHAPGGMPDMTGKTIKDEDGGGSGTPQEGAGSSGFTWDDATQLYFHAGTGFYHDPAAGWYYSSSDGLYYQFEKGAYVPCPESCRRTGDSSRGSGEPFSDSASSSTELEAANCQISSSTTLTDPLGTCDRGGMDEKLPPPPSEWLEETLIDIYLSGSSRVHDATSNIRTLGSIGKDATKFQACHSNLQELQPSSRPGSIEILVSEQLPKEENEGWASTSENLGEDEEKWQAQYGQVLKSDEEPPTSFRAIDLWDWSFVVESEKHSTSSKKKCGKRQVARLVGRLNNTSCSLHPSVPSTNFLKTASVCEVQLDLVRVATGKVYRLRNPSSTYLASLSSYDASNPTKDWGFPEFYISQRIPPFAETTMSQRSIKDVDDKNSPAKTHQSGAKNSVYKDRAALRRVLHGGYGIGFREKDATYEDETRPFSEIEAANMSIGPGSYARRIMENMGWKEGKVLGKTKDGLVEPLKVIGNKGYAGLGWNKI